MKQKKEIEERIKKLRERIKISNNSCVGLAKEEWESFENDRKYLEILEEKLKKIDK